MILYYLGRTNPSTVKLEDVRSDLYDHVFRMKLNESMGKLFDQMQQTASITNHLDPTKSRQPAKARPVAETATRAGTTVKR